MDKKSVCFKLNDPPLSSTDPETWIKKGIASIIQHVVKDVKPGDKVGFTFTSDNFHKEGYLSFRDADKVNFEDVWNLLGSIYQSNAAGFDTDTFRMTMTAVRPIKGSGRVRSYNTYEEECSKRRGIIVINNKDNLCFPRALVVAMAYIMNVKNLKQIIKNAHKLQDQEVVRLMNETGIQVPKEGTGIEEIGQFQNYLKDFKITIYKYGAKGREVLYEGLDAPNKINLLHHNNHFNVITNLTAAFVCRYYCEDCHIPYNNKNEHACFRSCPCCQQTPPCEKTREEIHCQDCNRKFRGLTCYNKHKSKNSVKIGSVCSQVKRCEECLRVIKRGHEHVCGEVFCKICNQYTSPNHYCYMQVDKRNPKTDDLLFIFYDLETRQDMILENGTREHIPNLCILQQRCDHCIDEKNLYFCMKCGYREVIYKDNVISLLVQHILAMRKKFKKVVVIAHNGQAFDHQFLLHHIMQSTDLQIDLIMRGTKIIMLSFDNVKFIDSLNYFPMPLATLPKAFDLGTELRKGYFPHLFNTLENSNYAGPMPNISYYSPDNMKDDARCKFLEWYEKHKLDRFDLQKELVEYCRSDVDILVKACLQFRKMFIEECNVCPFTESATIASACNLVYRRNFLKSSTIGIMPANGYRYADNQSKIAIQWLIWEELQRGINIQHSAKQKEVVISGVKVDGYSTETNQIFEFFGCYYHGHSCITTNRDKPTREDPSDTLNNRYGRTVMKINRLRQNGYEVIEMWECQFRKQMQLNDQINLLTEKHPLLVHTPLVPQDAFYGGRTENIRTFYQVADKEKIKYVDVCSLYPWVCKYGKFPLGHPKIYVGDKCEQLNLNEIEGLVKCKVLAPQNLHLPVLPTKMNNKLLFVLCRTCGDTVNQDECNHNENERCLIGTWVVDEIRKAIEKGYKILEIYEVWSYAVTQYDGLENLTGLFTEMMNKFIKMKTQASGWPLNCITKEEKDQYVNDFFKIEGIQLEFSKIVKNAGLRSLAKLMLNSFWGKFGQRQNQPKTSIIRQPNELYDIVNDPSKYVNNIQEVNEEVLIVSWEYVEEAVNPLSTVNKCIAAYVTTQARLKLYSYLDQLGDRVLYYDTDSVIYISREGEPDVPTGSFLGDMTDELEEYGPGSYIVAFASGGPKSYGYIVFSPKYNTYYTLCKVKGFSLNFNASNLINFYTMRAKSVEEDLDPIAITSVNIRRTMNHKVISREETKIFKPTSNKRVFSTEFNSLPYGHKKVKY